MTFLFSDTIFGPVRSRRFGNSLGINLLPNTYKICSYDCIYCECGFTLVPPGKKDDLPTRELVAEQLEKRLRLMKQQGQFPDNITFAGNGEPTLHPAFAGIMEDTLKLRNKYFPEAKITVLSNGSMIHREDIRQALLKADHNVLKLDAGLESSFRLINRPPRNLTLEQVVRDLLFFKGNLIIQTMFVRGVVEGHPIDNTTPEETSAWLAHLLKIHPRLVMIYSIARETPVEGLIQVPHIQLQKIAQMVSQAGLEVEVY
ncbi:MAG: radical SAM protein [Bacteroidales bacterium]